MLLEMAIADAYGSGFEFRRRDSIDKYNDIASFHPYSKHKVIPGKYTDDTQMSIAICEILIDSVSFLGDVNWTWKKEDIADKFIKVFHRDPIYSYSPGFLNILKSSLDGKSFLSSIKPDSEKSGAAMRAMPIGVLSSIPQVMKLCSVQAEITHNTPKGIAAAQASSLMAHYLYHSLGPKTDLPKFLELHIPNYNWEEPWENKKEVGTSGIECTRAALTSICSENSLAGILKKSVDFGGDTDTVAAIAVACSSLSISIPNDLPSSLVDGLIKGNFGKTFLTETDNKILALFKRKK